MLDQQRIVILHEPPEKRKTMNVACPEDSLPGDQLDLIEALLVKLGEGAAPPPELYALLADPALDPQPPRLAPEAARRSTAEARLLLRALRPADQTPLVTPSCSLPLPGPVRAGYRLEGGLGEPPRIYPFFAAALGEPGAHSVLTQTFPDLWAVDLALWVALERAAADPSAPARLALAWLRSPGRRLLHQPEILRCAPRQEPSGATDLRLAALYSAAGADARDAPPAWHELHDAVPGAELARWAPVAPAGDAVLRALRLLDGHVDAHLPPSVPAAALLWLLRRAVREPLYHVEGIQRDLREDLPVRLVALLDRDDAEVRLETMTLLHAALLTQADAAPRAVERGYQVARWLHGCLTRSLYEGLDAEGLAARLRSWLPRELPQALLRPAPLCLGRYREDGLLLTEVLLTEATAAHYLTAEGLARSALRPVPPPLTTALQRLAARPLRPLELDAQRVQDAAGLAAPLPIAPPLGARALLSWFKIPWLVAAPAAVQEETRALYASPLLLSNRWLHLALNVEGEALTAAPGLRALGVALVTEWRRWHEHHQQGHAEPEARDLALAAIGLLALFSPGEHAAILALCLRAQDAWPPYLLDDLASAAERQAQPRLWHATQEALLAVAEDGQRQDALRLNAALFAVRRLSGSERPEREPLLARWATLVAGSPFREHPRLQRELRMLGHAVANGGRFG